jgi:hypothetical protein
VAVPGDLESLRHVADPLFIPVTHAEAAARPGLFPDGRPADLIHAWTPREGVRKFVLAYQRAVVAAGGTPARLIVHLEDNEHFLLENYTGRTLAQLRALPAGELASLADDRLPHPFRAESFLRLADAVTHIIAPLAEFAPPGTPTHLLLPGVNFALYRPDLTGSAEVAAVVPQCAGLPRRGRTVWLESECLLHHYKFYLAAENSREPDYVTEKLWQGLRAGAVPVYLGAPNVRLYLPEGAAVFVDEELDGAGPHDQRVGAVGALLVGLHPGLHREAAGHRERRLGGHAGGIADEVQGVVTGPFVEVELDAGGEGEGEQGREEVAHRQVPA